MIVFYEVEIDRIRLWPTTPPVKAIRGRDFSTTLAKKRRIAQDQVSTFQTSGERCGKPVLTCGFALCDPFRGVDIVESRALARRASTAIRYRHRTQRPLELPPFGAEAVVRAQFVGMTSASPVGQGPFSTPVEEHVDNAGGAALPEVWRDVRQEMDVDGRNGTRGSRSRWEEEHSWHKRSGPKIGGRSFRRS